MVADPKDSLRDAVRTAQERYEEEADKGRELRREAFAKAQSDGLTQREIAEAVGLHHTRVGQIIRGE